MPTSFDAKVSANQQMYANPNRKRALHPCFQPGPLDVICARGKAAHKHEGNVRFRDLVNHFREEYAAKKTSKQQKSKIVTRVVNTIRQASPHGGFVKEINGNWYEVGDRSAKEKVGQTFRDLLHREYPSSTKAKAKVRIQRRKEKGQVGIDSKNSGRHESPDPHSEAEVYSKLHGKIKETATCHFMIAVSTSPLLRHFSESNISVSAKSSSVTVITTDQDSGANGSDGRIEAPAFISVKMQHSTKLKQKSLFETFKETLPLYPGIESGDILEPLPLRQDSPTEDEFGPISEPIPLSAVNHHDMAPDDFLSAEVELSPFDTTPTPSMNAGGDDDDMKFFCECMGLPL